MKNNVPSLILHLSPLRLLPPDVSLDVTAGPFDSQPGPVSLLRGDVLELLEVRRRRADVRHQLRVVQELPRLRHRVPDLLVVLPDEPVPRGVRELQILQCVERSGRGPRQRLQQRLAGDHVVFHNLAGLSRLQLGDFVSQPEQSFVYGVVPERLLLGHLRLLRDGRGIHKDDIVVVSSPALVRGSRRGVDEIVDGVDALEILRRRSATESRRRRGNLAAAHRRLPRLTPPLVRLFLGQLGLHHDPGSAALKIVDPSRVGVKVSDGAAKRSVVARGPLLHEPVGDDLNQEVLEQRLGDFHLLPRAVAGQAIVPAVENVLRLGSAERAPDSSLRPAAVSHARDDLADGNRRLGHVLVFEHRAALSLLAVVAHPLALDRVELLVEVTQQQGAAARGLVGAVPL
mmetsp:Transcript_6620/g.26962  ORF Transcript_6620/g.26962 Transcript_6620/m.26962 type:complete len:400 (+) Transcript_6620:863-2062(+)